MPDDGHAPRANFPLPRELRNIIYSYLLEGTNTRQVRLKDSNAATDRAGKVYQFHTSIMGVNQAIHDEGQYSGVCLYDLKRRLLISQKAEEYLYKNNIFIVVSFDWPNLLTNGPGTEPLSQALCSPVVTEKHAAKMQKHSLRLHVTRNMRHPALPASSTKTPIHSFLLLAKDMDALCFSLRFRLNPLRGFAVGIVESVAPGSHGRYRYMGVVLVGESHGKLKPPSLKIEFCDTRFRIADAKLQDKLLGSLKRVACPSMQVSLMGRLRLQENLLTSVKNRMGPNFVSYEALAWNHLDILVEAKKFSDLAVSSGEYGVALRMYNNIMDQIAQWKADMLFPDSTVTWSEVEALSHDIIINMGYLSLRIGNLPGLAYACSRLSPFQQALLASSTLNVETLEKMEAQGFYVLLLGELYARGYQEVPSRSELTVNSAIDILSKCSDEPYQQHDLAILKGVVDKDDLASRYLSRDQRSACKLAPFCSTSHQSDEFPKKPDYIVGLQNMSAMDQLDTRERGHQRDAAKV